MEETNKIQMRKRNMKLFPSYKAFRAGTTYFFIQ